MTPEEKRAARIATHYRAARRMQELCDTLAPDGRCQKCGTKPRVQRLQIDHVDGRDWEPRKHNMHIRAARYWREYLAGVRMRALCKKCNGAHRPPNFVNGVKKEHWYVPAVVELEPAPF